MFHSPVMFLLPDLQSLSLSIRSSCIKINEGSGNNRFLLFVIKRRKDWGACPIKSSVMDINNDESLMMRYATLRYFRRFDKNLIF